MSLVCGLFAFLVCYRTCAKLNSGLWDWFNTMWVYWWYKLRWVVFTDVVGSCWVVFGCSLVLPWFLVGCGYCYYIYCFICDNLVSFGDNLDLRTVMIVYWLLRYIGFTLLFSVLGCCYYVRVIDMCMIVTLLELLCVGVQCSDIFVLDSDLFALLFIRELVDFVKCFVCFVLVVLATMFFGYGAWFALVTDCCSCIKFLPCIVGF
eukprot:gene3411-2362_t